MPKNQENRESSAKPYRPLSKMATSLILGLILTSHLILVTSAVPTPSDGEASVAPTDETSTEPPQDGIGGYSEPSNDLDFDLGRSLDDDFDLGLEEFERGASFGHAGVAANQKPNARLQGNRGRPHPGAMPPPFPSLGGGFFPGQPRPAGPSGPTGPSGPNGPSGHPEEYVPLKFNPTSKLTAAGLSAPSGGQFAPERPDPARGLFYLEYIRYLLEFYPQPKGGPYGAPTCDLSQFSQCTCTDPPMFTSDGRGNCNLGVTKPDNQVWCYVSKEYGHPAKVCPDAKASQSRPGYHWSRIACITE